jgi:hypothetical protein
MTDTTDPALRTRLARVRAKTGWLESRGAASPHLNPPASEAAVATRETELGVELPAGYRAFVTAVGDGSDRGHPYGHPLLPFASPDRSGERVTDRSTDAHRAGRTPSTDPFPLVPSRWREDRRSAREGGADWWRETMGRDRYGPTRHRYPGLLLIARVGSVRSANLVVTGPARGRVVYVWEDADLDRGTGTPPRFPPAADFPAWYETWLDSEISGLPLPLLGLELAEPQGSPYHDPYIRDLMLLAAAVDRADRGEDGPVDGALLGGLARTARTARHTTTKRVRLAAVCSLSRGPERIGELRRVAEEADEETAGLARALLRART